MYDLMNEIAYRVAKQHPAEVTSLYGSGASDSDQRIESFIYHAVERQIAGIETEMLYMIILDAPESLRGSINDQLNIGFEAEMHIISPGLMVLRRLALRVLIERIKQIAADAVAAKAA